MDKSDDHVSHWLTDADLFEIADSLLFEVRLEERLEHLFNTYAKINGLPMFDAMISRLDFIKKIINRDLMEAIRDKEGEEDKDGNIRYYTITELREDRGYPTSTLFPAHFLKMPHISWKYVDNVTVSLKHFKLGKELTALKVEVGNLDKGNSNSSVREKFEKEGFELYIDESYRLKLMPFLIEQYKGKKPKQFVYMLYALKDLSILNSTCLAENQTQLHKALTNTFNNVGTRQSLQNNISIINGAERIEELNIRKHKNHIKAYLWPE